ncbi:enoyl-CoA hydratase/isomerase family protein [Saccharopolyspora sp. NPDC002376]
MSTVEIERRDSVGVVRLNRPERGNALDSTMPTGVRSAIEELGSDTAVSGIVLTGAGRLFCAGGDISTLLEWRELDLDGRTGKYLASQELVHAMKACPIPIIAAVNGAAAGAGVDLALAADLRIIADTASFTAAFASVGLVPDLGGSWFLARTIGVPHALRFLLAGQRMSAAEALEKGVVDQVVEGEMLLPTACEVIAELTAQVPRQVVTETLLAVRGAVGQDLATSMSLAARSQARLMSSPEHEERVAAFLSSSPRLTPQVRRTSHALGRRPA